MYPTMERECAEHVASFPGPRAAFSCTKECGGPGMFPHVCDVEGRKDLIEYGGTGAQNSKKSKGTR